MAAKRVVAGKGVGPFEKAGAVRAAYVRAFAFLATRFIHLNWHFDWVRASRVPLSDLSVRWLAALRLR